MAKKSNIKEFKEKIKNITNGEYSLIGEYFNSRTKVEILHKKCGYKYEVTPNAFLRGSRCPRCSGKMKKNTEIFKKEVFDLVGDEYKVLGEYINANTKIRMKHNKCGYEYEVIPNNFLRGSRCPRCSGKKTTEQFKKEVFDLVGDEYEVLGEYVYCSTKIRMKHNKCGYEYEVKPILFLRGVRCSKCAGVLKKTTGQFKKEVSKLVGDEYEVLGEYINANTKIRMKHNKCGCEYEVIPNAFLRGNRCPKCSGKMKKNTKIFKQEVFDLVGNEYIVLGEYITTDTKIKMKHNKCGCEYEVAPATFLHNHGCPNCFGKMKKNTKIFKQEVFDLVGNEYIVLGEYITTDTKIKMKHNKCGFKYEVKPNAFLRGNRCPNCFGTPLKTKEQFQKEVFDLVGDEYEVLGEYIDTNTKIGMKHNKCGFKYEVKPNSFINGSRCPRCGQARGEEKIFNFLSMIEFDIEKQYKFKDCKNIQPLPFDFAIFEKDNLKKLIEYDGIQHFQPVPQFGGEKSFKELKKNDKIKDKFCKDNRIPLIRISYKDFDNIEKILEKKLKLKHKDVIKRKKSPDRFKYITTKTEDFIEKVKNLTDNEYTVLSEYYNSKTKIRMKHNKCGYEYEVIPNSFLSGSRCPRCFRKIKKTIEQFKKEVFDLVGDEYKVLGEYINANIKIRMKHNKCGYEYEVTPHSFLRGSRCPRCSGKMKKTTGQFKKEVSNLVGDSRRSSNQDYGTGRGF